MSPQLLSELDAARLAHMRKLAAAHAREVRFARLMAEMDAFFDRPATPTLPAVGRVVFARRNEEKLQTVQNNACKP